MDQQVVNNLLGFKWKTKVDVDVDEDVNIWNLLSGRTNNYDYSWWRKCKQEFESVTQYI